MLRVNIQCRSFHYKSRSGHLDDELDKTAFASGTALRKALKGNRVEKVLREQLSYVQFDEEEYKTIGVLIGHLEENRLRSTDEELCAIYQMEEGIETA